MKQRPLKRLKNTIGTSLAEILVTVFVLAIGILSSLLYFSTALNSTKMARDMTVATTHAEFIMEDLYARSTRVELLNAIENEDWQTWGNAQFGSGSIMPSQLPSEIYAVTVADNTADPLVITTDISWIRNGRTNNVNLNTELTKDSVKSFMKNTNE